MILKWCLNTDKGGDGIMVYKDGNEWGCECLRTNDCLYDRNWRIRNRAVMVKIEKLHKQALKIREDARFAERKLEIEARALFYPAKVLEC